MPSYIKNKYTVYSATLEQPFVENKCERKLPQPIGCRKHLPKFTNTNNNLLRNSMSFKDSTSNLSPAVENPVADARGKSSTFGTSFGLSSPEWSVYHTVPQGPPARVKSETTIYHLFGQDPKPRQSLEELKPASSQHSIAMDNGWVKVDCSDVPMNSSPDTPGEDFKFEEDEEPLSPVVQHPNRYPVQIESHMSKRCGYARQPTRSGYKVKQLPGNPSNGFKPQQIKYYEKHLTRICRCRNYEQTDGPFLYGSESEFEGYEIHYSQKCKWKAYDDFKTGERVLIRLCKCYNLQTID